MKSPFPGMDPYLEDPAFWPDFHSRFLNCWCEALAQGLPDAYEARLDERVNLIHLTDEEKSRLFIPDVSVTKGARSSGKGSREAASAVLEPVTIPHDVVEEDRQAFIKVLHRPERTLVTVLELRSPANKTGTGYGDYCAWRNELLNQGVSLFELDLLIGGSRMQLRRPLPPAEYYAFVTRASRRGLCDVYPWRVRDPLPTLPVPLQSPDPDVQVDLRAVFAQTYQRGRYLRSLAYGQAPIAPLADAEREWAITQTKGTPAT
jgi:hypothetical protein